MCVVVDGMVTIAKLTGPSGSTNYISTLAVVGSVIAPDQTSAGTNDWFGFAIASFGDISNKLLVVTDVKCNPYKQGSVSIYRLSSTWAISSRYVITPQLTGRYNAVTTNTVELGIGTRSEFPPDQCSRLCCRFL
jgi:hypothetical protein